MSSKKQQQTLRQICEKSSRLSEVDYAAFKRELGAIEIHGLEDYFFDIYYSKKKVSNKETNSIVAYLIGITDEKPEGLIKYKGGTLADIDIDFAIEGRDRVIDYLKQKYGNEFVANIGTYGYMYAKNAIRFAGKALGISLDEVDAIARLIPEPNQGVHFSIDESVNMVKDLKTKAEKDPKIKDLLFWAKKLEGTISNKSKHAAGIIIADTPITDIAPVWKDGDQVVVEFDMNESESLGFVKADFLALKTLDVIGDTIDIIRKRRNVDIKFDEIPLDDPETYELLGTGRLLGVFQLEGRGISEFTRQFKPKHFMDISLISAGYRPGPIEFLMNILHIKNGDESKINIRPHSERFSVLKDILKDTYGYK